MWMVLGWTHARRRAMAPPAHTDFALMLASAKPTAGTAARTIGRIGALISSLLMVCHRLLLWIINRGVLQAELFHQVYPTWRHRAVTGQAWKFPVRPWYINHPLNPLFCVTKRRLIKSAEEKVILDGRDVANNCMLRRVEGCGTVLELPLQYYPVQRRNKRWSKQDHWLPVVGFIQIGRRHIRHG